MCMGYKESGYVFEKWGNLPAGKVFRGVIFEVDNREHPYRIDLDYVGTQTSFEAFNSRMRKRSELMELLGKKYEIVCLVANNGDGLRELLRCLNQQARSKLLLAGAA